MRAALRIAAAHEWPDELGRASWSWQVVRTTGADTLVSGVVNDRLTRAKFPGVQLQALWPMRLPGAQLHWPRYALPMIAACATTRIEG